MEIGDACFAQGVPHSPVWSTTNAVCVHLLNLRAVEPLPPSLFCGNCSSTDVPDTVIEFVCSSLSSPTMTASRQAQAFNTRMQEADGAYRCVSAYQLPAPRPQLRPREQRIRPGGADSTLNEVRGCSALSTVRGYLLVSHDSSVSAYNTTEEARLLFTKTQQAPAVEVRKDEIGDICGERGVIPFASPWAVLSSASSAEALVVEALPCSEVSPVCFFSDGAVATGECGCRVVSYSGSLTDAIK